MASGRIVNNFYDSYYTFLVLAITIITHYFGGARSTGFATVKLTFFDKIGHAKSVGFRFYSAT